MRVTTADLVADTDEESLDLTPERTYTSLSSLPKSSLTLTDYLDVEREPTATEKMKSTVKEGYIEHLPNILTSQFLNGSIIVLTLVSVIIHGVLLFWSSDEKGSFGIVTIQLMYILFYYSTVFILGLFALEQILKLITFRLRFFNLANLFDSLVIISSIVGEVVYHNTDIREFLSLIISLRLWRIMIFIREEKNRAIQLAESRIKAAERVQTEWKMKWIDEAKKREALEERVKLLEKEYRKRSKTDSPLNCTW